MADENKLDPLPAQNMADLQSAWKAVNEIPDPEVKAKAQKIIQDHLGDLTKKYDVGIKDPDSIARGALHGMDVLSGLTRTALATPIVAATQGLDRAKTDLANAAIPGNGGMAPTMDEYLARAGVPGNTQFSDIIPGYKDPNPNNKWYQPEKGGMLDINPRHMAATALDVATANPVALAKALGLMGKVAGTAAEARAMGMPKPGMVQNAIETASNPIGAVMNKAGEGLYATATPGVPAEGRAVMAGSNVFGSPSSQVDQVSKLISDLHAENEATIGSINKAAEISHLPKPKFKLQEMVKDAFANLDTHGAIGEGATATEAAQTARQELEAELLHNKPKGLDTEFDLSGANDFKRQMQEEASSRAAYGRQIEPTGMTDTQLKFRKDVARLKGEAYADIARNAKNAVEDTADQIVPGSGLRLKGTNAKIGSLIDAKGALNANMEAANAANYAKLSVPGRAMVNTIRALNAATGSEATRSAIGLLLKKLAPGVGPVAKSYAVESMGQEQPNPMEAIRQGLPIE